MKKILIGLSLLLLSSQAAFAHPGRTASDGCHYCRTNCDKWGVEWDVRHCHGGSTPNPTPTTTTKPTSTYSPTLTPKVITATPTKSINSTPTSETKPEVLGAVTSSPEPTSTPTPNPTPTTTSKQNDEKAPNSNGLAWLIVLGTVGTIGYRHHKQNQQV